MGARVTLKEKQRKRERVKPQVIKIFVCSDDLPEACDDECVKHCAKIMRRELNDFFGNYFFEVKTEKGADDFTHVFQVEKPEDVMDKIYSMASYVAHILTSPEKWCQCNRWEED